jgi:hypothetical protein
MGLKSFYYSLEDKHYQFLDWLDSKGIGLYKLDDWLNSHKIPSFPLVLILSTIILALVIWGVVSLLFISANNVNYTVNFKDVTLNTYVPNLEVQVSLDGDTENRFTDAAGELALVGPEGSVATFVLVGDNLDYELLSTGVILDSDGGSSTLELRNLGSFLTKTFSVYEDYDEKILFDAPMNVELECSNVEYYGNAVLDTGTFTVSDLPSNCGTLYVTFEDETYGEANTEDENPFVEFKGQAIKKGKISVMCLDAEGNPLNSIEVSAVNAEGLMKADEGQTSDAGTTLLEVPIGKYILVANDLEGLYATITTSDEGENYWEGSVMEGQEISATIHFTNANLGSLKFKVIDTSGDAVTSGSVIIYKNNLQLIEMELGNEEGLIEYNIGDLSSKYRVVIDSPQYMNYEKDELVPSEEPITIILTPASSNPSLIIKAVGEKGEPIPNATVQIFKKPEDSLILTKLTNAEGEAEFRRLEAGIGYYAKVYKLESSVETRTLVLSARTKNVLDAVLELGDGEVQVTVHKEGELFKGASVEFYDALNNKPIGVVQTTTEEGTAKVVARADKKVYAKVSVPESAEFYTLPIDVESSLVVHLDGYIYDKVSTPESEFIKLETMSGEEIGSNPLNILPGQSYYAYFLLKVPDTSSYDKMDFFVKADDALEFEKASVHIDSVEVLGAKIEKGLTYNPPNNYALDRANLTSDKALWAEASIDNVRLGITLAKVKLTVVTEPVKNTLSLNYNFYLKKGNQYLRDPIDVGLGQNASVADKHGLYADTKKMVLLAGSSICNTVLCLELEATDTTGFNTKVFDTLPAEINSQYKIDARILGITKRSFQNATLEIYSKNNGIELKSVVAKLKGRSINATLSGKKVVVPLSSIDQTTLLTLDLGLEVLKEGTSLLTFEVKGGAGEEIFLHEVNLPVEAARDMSVALSPNVVMPYLENVLAVFVTDVEDDMPLENSLVNVFLNDIMLSSGKTDFEGIFGFELSKPNVGDELRVEVERSGYDKIVNSTIISENILVPDPSLLGITVHKDARSGEAGDFELTNASGLKLRIVDMYFDSGIYKDLIDLGLEGSYVGKDIDTNMLIEWYANLTDAGKNLLEAKEFETTLNIKVTSDEVSKTWLTQIPVTLYIRLAESLDSSDCLKIFPVTELEGSDWALAVGTDSNEITLDFRIVNECTQEAEPVSLNGLKLGVTWKGKVLGKFSHDGKELTKEGIDIDEILGPDEYIYTLKFSSKEGTISDDAKAVIKATAVYATSRGLQDLEASTEGKVIVSILNKCVEIIGPQGALTGEDATTGMILLGAMPMNLGFNMAQQYMGQRPYGQSNIYQGGVPGTGYPYQTYPGAGVYPTPGAVPANNQYYAGLGQRESYSDPRWNTSSNPAFNQVNPAAYMQQNLMQTNQGLNPNMLMAMGSLPSSAEITIRNNCKFPVKIYLKSQPQLTVSKKNFDVGVGKSSEFNVSSGGFVGNYSVDVSVARDSENTVPLASIPVRIMASGADAGSDCVSLSTGNKINFSGINTILQVTAYNNCYSKGITFDRQQPVAYENLLITRAEIERKYGDTTPNYDKAKEINNEIDELTKKRRRASSDTEKDKYDREIDTLKNQLRNSELHKRNTQQGSSWTQSMQTREPYALLRVVGMPDIVSDPISGNMESVKLILQRNTSFITPTSEIRDTPDTIFGGVQSALQFRGAISEAYMNVNFPAIMVFNMKSGLGYGGVPKRFEKMITVVDHWNWLAASDMFAKGSRIANPACNQSMWEDYIKDTMGTIKVYKTDFDNGDTIVLPVEGFNAFSKMNNGDSCFGSGDEIKLLARANNLSAIHGSFTVTPEIKGHKMYLRIKYSSAKGNAFEQESANYNGEIKFNINSSYHGMSEEGFTIKYELYVNGKEAALSVAETRARQERQAAAGNQQQSSSNNNLGTGGSGAQNQANAQDPATLAAITACNQLSGGYAPMSTYGSRLSFDYENINCDPFASGSFCDAQQFAAHMTKAEFITQEGTGMAVLKDDMKVVNKFLINQVFRYKIDKEPTTSDGRIHNFTLYGLADSLDSEMKGIPLELGFEDVYPKEILEQLKVKVTQLKTGAQDQTAYDNVLSELRKYVPLKEDKETDNPILLFWKIKSDLVSNEICSDQSGFIGSTENYSIGSILKDKEGKEYCYILASRVKQDNIETVFEKLSDNKEEFNLVFLINGEINYNHVSDIKSKLVNYFIYKALKSGDVTYLAKNANGDIEKIKTAINKVRDRKVEEYGYAMVLLKNDTKIQEAIEGKGDTFLQNTFKAEVNEVTGMEGAGWYFAVFNKASGKYNIKLNPVLNAASLDETYNKLLYQLVLDPYAASPDTKEFGLCMKSSLSVDKIANLEIPARTCIGTLVFEGKTEINNTGHRYDIELSGNKWIFKLPKFSFFGNVGTGTCKFEGTSGTDYATPASNLLYAKNQTIKMGTGSLACKINGTSFNLNENVANLTEVPKDLAAIVNNPDFCYVEKTDHSELKIAYIGETAR